MKQTDVKIFTDSIVGNWFVLMGLPMPGILTYILIKELFGFPWSALAGVGVIVLISPLYSRIIRTIHKIFG